MDHGKQLVWIYMNMTRGHGCMVGDVQHSMGISCEHKRCDKALLLQIRAQDWYSKYNGPYAFGHLMQRDSKRISPDFDMALCTLSAAERMIFQGKSSAFALFFFLLLLLLFPSLFFALAKFRYRRGFEMKLLLLTRRRRAREPLPCQVVFPS